MGPGQIALRLRQLARAEGEATDIEFDRPLREDESDEQGCRGHGGSGAFRAPGDHNRRCDQERERRERRRIVAGGKHEKCRAAQIDGERAGRDGVDAAGGGVRAEQQARNDQRGDQHEANHHVEDVRRQNVDAIVEAGGQRP
jgi:hypothetical protein